MGLLFSRSEVRAPAEAAPVVVRALREDELDDWARFCAACFAAKSPPPPPSHFKGHFEMDPTRDASAIRVAVDASSGEYLATLRIFSRRATVRGGASVEVGGIGEVCTAPHARRRGLARRLLSDAISIMRERRMDYSLLHAANAVAPVYAKLGWRSVPMTWVCVPASAIPKCDDTAEAAPLNISAPGIRERLSFIHRAAERSALGTFVRSDEYWSAWIVATVTGEQYRLWGWTPAGATEMEAFAALRVYPDGNAKLADFAVRSVSDTARALSTMLAKAIAQENAAVTTVKCPSLCITSEFRQGLVGPTRDEDDGPPGGWMVLPLEEASKAPTPRDAAHHLVWPIDGF